MISYVQIGGMMVRRDTGNVKYNGFEPRIARLFLEDADPVVGARAMAEDALQDLDEKIDVQKRAYETRNRQLADRQGFENCVVNLCLLATQPDGIGRMPPDFAPGLALCLAARSLNPRLDDETEGLLFHGAVEIVSNTDILRHADPSKSVAAFCLLEWASRDHLKRHCYMAELVGKDTTQHILGRGNVAQIVDSFIAGVDENTLLPADERHNGPHQIALRRFVEAGMSYTTDELAHAQETMAHLAQKISVDQTSNSENRDLLAVDNVLRRLIKPVCLT